MARTGTTTISAVSSDTNALVPTMLPSSNQTLELAITATNAAGTSTVLSGTMNFELFDTSYNVNAIVSHIESLVTNQSFYNNWQFSNSTTGTLQASPPSGGTASSGTTYDDGYIGTIRFTAAGMLAMAKSGNDLNDAQFFVTTQAMPSYDFRYTTVGFMTK